MRMLIPASIDLLLLYECELTIGEPSRINWLDAIYYARRPLGDVFVPGANAPECHYRAASSAPGSFGRYV